MKFQQKPEFKDVIEAVRRAAYGYGAQAVAIELGCSQEYLRKITNPEPNPDEERHIQLRAFTKIIEVTGDKTAAHILMAHLGIDGEEVEPLSVDNAREALAEVQIRMGKVLDELHEALKDGVLEKKELLNIFEKVHEAYEALGVFKVSTGKAVTLSSPEVRQ